VCFGKRSAKSKARAPPQRPFDAFISLSSLDHGREFEQSLFVRTAHLSSKVEHPSGILYWNRLTESGPVLHEQQTGEPLYDA